MPDRIRARFKNIQDLPIKITDSIGSNTSLVWHSIFFVAIFALRFLHIATSDILLILTTVVSLEAIYLSIFIQMTVNRNTQSLEEVEEDIEGIEKDIDEIQEDVEDIEKDVDEMEEDDNAIDNIQSTLQKLIKEIEDLKQKNNPK